MPASSQTPTLAEATPDYEALEREFQQSWLYQLFIISFIIGSIALYKYPIMTVNVLIGAAILLLLGTLFASLNLPPETATDFIGWFYRNKNVGDYITFLFFLIAIRLALSNVFFLEVLDTLFSEAPSPSSTQPNLNVQN